MEIKWSGSVRRNTFLNLEGHRPKLLFYHNKNGNNNDNVKCLPRFCLSKSKISKTRKIISVEDSEGEF